MLVEPPFLDRMLQAPRESVNALDLKPLFDQAPKPQGEPTLDEKV